MTLEIRIQTVMSKLGKQQINETEPKVSTL